ncbi:MAG TPA: NAD(P)H-dependent oxidoreductase subunit E [Thermosynergistes sp.]|nr:NAD(P)H-dependent oxidoreductase subunit E [Thermosynergistes sp.]HPU77514.1 NAD(P)H-dependent oxidoreductase subunit E [Thermosynergistes sp.]HPZ76581.1 NAD(P)H-dependent oxidoreductase subunit E [Thermosynergistes sp.]HXK88995.1 NAD(P)H-dependent oxidoreductase subunit E [Thermosynergistes sp.]
MSGKAASAESEGKALTSRATEAPETEEILRRYPPDPRHLLSILLDIQAEHRYLPRETLKTVSDYLRVPEAQVYAMATFYKVLSLKPKGRSSIKVCMGTACHLRGNVEVLRALGEHLGISPGETTSDRAFTLEVVYCLGCCSLAPAMMIDEAVYGRLTPKKAISIVEELQGKVMAK